MNILIFLLKKIKIYLLKKNNSDLILDHTCKPQNIFYLFYCIIQNK